MSPILVRPVREQLEHDRIIRLLEIRLKRKGGEVTTNLGGAETTPVKVGQGQVYPDLVLFSAEKAGTVAGTVEVETAESVNHLEAMAEWVHYARAKVPFHLYVPAGSVESARRLIAENAVSIAEIWTYHTLGDQTRFTLVHRAPEAARPAAEARRPAEKATATIQVRGGAPAAARPTASRTPKTAAPARKAGSPARKTVSAGRKITPPVRSAAPVARKATTPARKAGTPVRKTGIPARKTGAPARKAAAPARKAARPAAKKAATRKPARAQKRK